MSGKLSDGRKRASLRDDITEALMDSQYLAGVTAGWNAANSADPERELAAIRRGREGHLAALKAALTQDAPIIPPHLERLANPPDVAINYDWDGDEGREGRRELTEDEG
jgi:hypothetical protein